MKFVSKPITDSAEWRRRRWQRQNAAGWLAGCLKVAGVKFGCIFDLSVRAFRVWLSMGRKNNSIKKDGEDFRANRHGKTKHTEPKCCRNRRARLLGFLCQAWYDFHQLPPPVRDVDCFQVFFMFNVWYASRIWTAVIVTGWNYWCESILAFGLLLNIYSTIFYDVMVNPLFSTFTFTLTKLHKFIGSTSPRLFYDWFRRSSVTI